MKKLLIYLAVSFLYSTGELCGEKIVVSLGKDCQPAWRLKQLGLRRVAYPFDWLRTYNFKGLNACIHENFRFFLTADDLIYEMYGLKSKRYGMEFVHDFPTVGKQSTHVALENENAGTVVSNYRDYLPQMNEKYYPRIKRFIEAFDSQDEVIFIRTHITPSEAQMFVTMMDADHPKLNYTLVVVHGNKHLHHNWNMKHVMSFYVEKPDTSNQNGWWHESEWLDIFKKLNLISGSFKQYRMCYRKWSDLETD